MKKILLFGKLNDVLKDLIKGLSEYFQVQLCELKSEAAEGMIGMFEPHLIIISLVGAQEYDKRVFRILSNHYYRIPVITIGTESEKSTFLKYYEDGQFENLIRPVENRDVIAAVCARLNLKISEKEEKEFVEEPLLKNVLLVDDNPMTLRNLSAMLKGYYDVSVATSGIKAMTEIGRRRPDIIILDYEMPVCDGRQTLEMIRAEEDLKDIPVIFLTGINDKEHVQAVLKLKPQGYLLKPPTRLELMTEIEKYI
ncbi:MAG: response regulator [Lachnospiraceae bacterium]|nr:response regulator [Lachnospiraceae bacterium]